MKLRRFSEKADSTSPRLGWLLASIIVVGGQVADLRSVDAAPDEAGDPAAPAEHAPAGSHIGRLVRVPVPIRGRGDDEAKQVIERALAHMKSQQAAGAAGRPTLILEFSAAPGDTKFGGGTDFFRALSLARFLTGSDLSAVRTVAYLPHTIKGHAVLAVMACDMIVMAPDAELGEASIDEDPAQPIDEAIMAGYEQIASRRRTLQLNVVRGMLDRQYGVWKVETESGVEFVLQKDLDAVRRRKAVRGEPQEIFARGKLGKFTGSEARDWGLISYLAPDRMSVAHALELPPEALEPESSLVGELHPVRIMLTGKIDTRLAETRRRMIEKSLRDEHVNMICLWIDSPGGEAEPATKLARYLVGQDPARVLTVAYIPREARGVAALVALACDQVVMRRGAMLGGGDIVPGVDELRDLESALRDDVVIRHKRTWSLPLALVSPTLPVHEYVNPQSKLTEYYSPDEWKALPDASNWHRGRQLTLDGRALTLTADEASQVGLLRERGVVDGFAQLKALYGLERDPALVEPGWVDEAVHVLASTEVAWLLLLFGLAGLYVELHAPGTGVGGFVAAVAFILFFWSHYLEQTAGALEIALFVTGLAFMGLEIFAFPGVGVFGVGGGLMVIVSLVLAGQTFVIPNTASEVRELRDSLLVVGGAGVGFVALAVGLRHFLPRSPILNRILLEPPQGEQAALQLAREAMVDYRHLLGSRGRTVTQLTPSGKARFAGDLIDVISDGQVIPVDSEIVVVEVHGNRVIVEQAG